MHRIIAITVVALVASTALVSASHATEGIATADDFWKHADSATSFAPYHPTRKAILAAGLEVPKGPPAELSLVMECAREWNISAAYPIAGSDQFLSIYQAPNANCTPDFGAGDAPASPSTFKASGGAFTLRYEGCASTPEGGVEPAAGQCAQADRIYSVFGSWPKHPGHSNPTVMYLSTQGTPESAIKSFVRSMRPVR